MSKVVVALDGMDAPDAVSLAGDLRGKVWGFKVRFDALLGGGVSLIRSLKRYGSVFVDPKDYDIISSQERDSEDLIGAGVDLVTLHASGGRTRMKRALEAVRGSGTRLLAVTVLTDYPDEEVLEVYNAPRQDVVLRLATMARESGMHGLVCSAAELPLFAGWAVLKVLPGFRPFGPVIGEDQLRVAGYPEARAADIVVVGRPVTGAADPVVTAAEINAGLKAV